MKKISLWVLFCFSVFGVSLSSYAEDDGNGIPPSKVKEGFKEADLITQRQEIRGLKNAISILEKGNDEKRKRVEKIDLEMRLLASAKVQHSIKKGIVPDRKWVLIASEGIKAIVDSEKSGGYNAKESIKNEADYSLDSSDNKFNDSGAGGVIEPLMVIDEGRVTLSVVFDVGGRFLRVKKGGKLPGFDLYLFSSDKEMVVLKSKGGLKTEMAFGQRFNKVEENALDGDGLITNELETPKNTQNYQ